MSNNPENLEAIIDERLDSKEFWYKTFAELVKSIGEDELRIKIAKVDGYFLEARGKDSLRNIKKGLAAVLVVRKACIAMQKYMNQFQTIETDLNFIES
jgi:hypothetical protein